MSRDSKRFVPAAFPIPESRITIHDPLPFLPVVGLIRDTGFCDSFNKKGAKKIPTQRRLLNMSKLAGKIAVITGGNSGIGYASAKEFKEKGATVVITGRNEEKVKKAASELAAR